MKSISAILLILPLSSAAHAGDVVFNQEVRIKAPPEAVWDALVNPERVKIYHLAPLQKIELKKDGEIIYGRGGRVMISGTITEIEPNVRLVHTFRFGPDTQPGTAKEGDTVVTYTLKKEGEMTVLSLQHSGFLAKNQGYANATGGWPILLKKLKVMLETAKPT